MFAFFHRKTTTTITKQKNKENIDNNNRNKAINQAWDIEKLLGQIVSFIIIIIIIWKKVAM